MMKLVTPWYGALLLAGALAIRSAPARAGEDPGARIYADRCASCHGGTGKGDGPTAEYLTPAPRNFGDAEFWKGQSPARIRETIHKGRVGTSMPQFEGVLSDADIDAVARFVESFAPHAAGHGTPPAAGPGQDAPRK